MLPSDLLLDMLYQDFLLLLGLVSWDVLVSGSPRTGSMAGFLVASTIDSDETFVGEDLPSTADSLIFLLPCSLLSLPPSSRSSMIAASSFVLLSVNIKFKAD